MPIPIQQWEWLGHPQHFIAADSCRFRLATRVGAFVVSTIGDYYLSELAAKAIGRDPNEPEEIGYRRKFETMVFAVADGGGRKPCGCPELRDYTELETVPYNDGAAAQRGHMDVCRQYAERQDAPS